MNDAVLTKDAVYFTDSFSPVLYKLPLGPNGALPGPAAVQTIALTGDYVNVPMQLNANGIVATPDGKTLIVVQTNAGLLWRVDAATGRATQINLGGASVANGDGLLLVGRTLYVVRNRLNRIAVITLQPDFASGRVTRNIASRQFDVPTTIARVGDRLYAANARFGTTASSSTRYWVTRVSR